MPPDVVTIVSTGIGVSVIAGVLSGFCYILAHGYTKRRSRKAAWNCAVCGIYLRARTAEIAKVVICVECGERVCKLRCSKREFAKKGWICYYCLKKSTWLQDMLHTVTVRFKKLRAPNRLVIKQGGKMEENPVRKQEKECVREFIEKLVSTILGGSVDDASIYRIYNDKQYNLLFERYHEDLSNAITSLSSTLQLTVSNTSFSDQTPSSAHVTLKHLIQKILNDALRLPNFRQAVDATDGPDENQRTYEHLLATAILNKIISKQQNELPSSSEANKEFSFGDETIEDKWRSAELESASTSSLEEFLHSDSSLGSTKYVDRVSLTIQQRIDYDDFDDTPRRQSSLLADDESNWSLKRRQFRATNSPIPVPMLVPNPIISAKVLIGDKEVDETSDLSDVASEVDEIDSPSIIEDIRIDSKVVIGEDYASDEETSFDSGVRDDRDDFSDREKFYGSQPKTDITVDDENVEDVSLTSFASNVEKDSEYLEKYASLPKAYTSLPPDLNQSLLTSDGNDDVRDDDVFQLSEVFEGSYSKKEKEKWRNPVTMQNNPYSKENIKKRIRTNERYGRDYYTKQASIPSGKQKTDEKNDVWITENHDEENKTYRAVPVTTNETESEAEEPKISVTSDSDLSLVNYYDVKNSAVYYHSSDNDPKEIKVTINHKEPVTPPSVVVTVNQKEPLTPLPDVYSNITTPMVDEEGEDVDKFEYIRGTELPTSPPVIKTFAPALPRVPPPRTFHPVDTSTPNQPAKPTAAPRALAMKSMKSDNTLIKKIYSNPTVRSFALGSRDHIPNAIDVHINKPSEKPQSPIEFNDYETWKTPVKKLASPESDKINTNYEINESYADKLQNRINDTSFAFSLEFSDSEPVSRERQSPVTDYDFKELNEKHLVANRLGQFSKSFPNLNAKVIIDQNQNEIREDPSEADMDDPSTLSHFVSVKNLRKLFERNDNHQRGKEKPVHSLTARSLSKQMKERLRSGDLSE